MERLRQEKILRRYSDRITQSKQTQEIFILKNPEGFCFPMKAEFQTGKRSALIESWGLDVQCFHKLLHLQSLSERFECLFLDRQQSAKCKTLIYLLANPEPRYHTWNMSSPVAEGECPAHRALKCLNSCSSIGWEWCMDMCSVTSQSFRVLTHRFGFLTISAVPSTPQAFILVLLGSFSTVELPVITQIDFYPCIFILHANFTKH